MADSLRVITENTAKYSGGNYIKNRWIETIAPKKRDARTGAEIATDVIKKAGLKVVGKAESV